MTASWNFRQILDVRPDSQLFTCVGTTKKRERCRNRIAQDDISSAATILNRMDRCKKLNSSYEHLEELASMTLCRRWHRQPGHSQIDAMCSHWQLTIAKYERVVKSEALTNLKAVEKVFVDDLDEEKKCKPSVPSSQILKTRSTNTPISKRVPTVKPTLEDPFTHHPNLASASPLVFGRIPTEPSILRPARSDCSSSRSQPASVASNIKLEKVIETLDTQLPSISGLPTLAITGSCVDEELQSEEVDEVPSTPTKTATGRLNHQWPVRVKRTTVISANTETVASHNLSSNSGTLGLDQTETSHATKMAKLPPTPDAILVPRSLFGNKSGSESQDLLPTFSFAFAQNGTHTLGTTNRRPLSQQNQTPSAAGIAPEFDLSFKYKVPLKSFDFEPPKKSSFGMCLPERSIPQISPPKEKTDEDFSKPAIPPKAAVPPVETAPIIIINPTQTPQKVKSESFGYATVSPESVVRYKTFLPAAKKHGLITPPDTPSDSPNTNTGSHQGGLARSTIQSPVVRKPVPVEKKAVEVLVQEMCPRCGMGGADACHCKTLEESIKSGCFHSLGLRRLKARAMRKIDSLRANMPGRTSDAAKS